MKYRVLITCRQLQETIEPYRSLFDERGIEIEMPTVVQQLTERELLDIIDRFDGVVAGDDHFTANVLEKAKRLKVISKWGIGVDAIDQCAAKRLGIRVCNTPNAFAEEVADVVLGYIILLSRKLHELHQGVRSGDWRKVRGTSLHGKTLGVIGLGSIGQAVVSRADVLGMVCVGYDVASVPASLAQETKVRMVDLDELLAVADFISLNCNLTPLNYHMLGEREFSRMKTGVHIINTARGKLVDESALAQAIGQRKVAGAALDVFEEEPLPLSSPLRELDSCIFGSHNSSNTIEAVMRVNELAIRNLLDGLDGSGS
jgi:D-3-phosphoglycerate dehydrogenase / 2-oxoglutarate reductase